MKAKSYKCPDCNNPIETMIPTKDLVAQKGYWDSAVVCPHCKGSHFKKVCPGGKINIIRMDDV